MFIRKQLFMIICCVFLMTSFLASSSSAAQDRNAKKTVKIIWHNKDITEKLYPTISKGRVYVIDSNFMRTVRGYSKVNPIFMKNDIGEWRQSAILYSLPNPTTKELLFNIRVYTNRNAVKVNDLNGSHLFSLQDPTFKAVKKMGVISYSEQEAKWVSDGTGMSYKPDRVVKRVEGEFFLHYLSLSDLCNMTNRKLSFHKESNTFTIQ